MVKLTELDFVYDIIVEKFGEQASEDIGNEAYKRLEEQNKKTEDGKHNKI